MKINSLIWAVGTIAAVGALALNVVGTAAFGPLTLLATFSGVLACASVAYLLVVNSKVSVANLLTGLIGLYVMIDETLQHFVGAGLLSYFA